MNKKTIVLWLSSLFFLLYSSLSFASAKNDFTFEGQKINPVCVWLFPAVRRWDYSGFMHGGDGKVHLHQVFLDSIPLINDKTVNLSVCQKSRTVGKVSRGDFTAPGWTGYVFPGRTWLNKNVPQGEIGYFVLGKTANGHIVLQVSQNGGGNGYFDSILLVDLKKENGITQLRLYSNIETDSPALKGIGIIDSIVIKGNTLTVKGYASKYDDPLLWATRTVNVAKPVFALQDDTD